MMRIGHSRDTHRLKKGSSLVLGGIEIPSPYEAVGHSDADCLLHAVSEAILGALALKDLGSHFPDTLASNEGLDSKEILGYTVKLMRSKGFELVNLDATVHLETPKLSAHIDTMRETIAKIMHLNVGQISIKATTGEKVGPVGRSEAIVAECVVLVEKKQRIKPL
ncbi:MAG: 2-C-methyl-D-erythritol 2,4-cyclodiphosphate synthase [Bacillota bacterium]